MNRGSWRIEPCSRYPFSDQEVHSSWTAFGCFPLLRIRSYLFRAKIATFGCSHVLRFLRKCVDSFTPRVSLNISHRIIGLCGNIDITTDDSPLYGRCLLLSVNGRCGSIRMVGVDAYKSPFLCISQRFIWFLENVYCGLSRSDGLQWCWDIIKLA
jgi:hypothetical protein